jgi:hypothetical protein
MDIAECEQHDEHQPARKRQRLSAVAEAEQQQQQLQHEDEIEHILYIRWHGNAGQTKLNRVGLTRLDNGVDSLKVGEARAHTNQCALEDHGGSIGCLSVLPVPHFAFLASYVDLAADIAA